MKDKSPGYAIFKVNLKVKEHRWSLNPDLRSTLALSFQGRHYKLHHTGLDKFISWSFPLDDGDSRVAVSDKSSTNPCIYHMEFCSCISKEAVDHKIP